MKTIKVTLRLYGENSSQIVKVFDEASNIAEGYRLLFHFAQTLITFEYLLTLECNDDLICSIPNHPKDYAD